MQEAGNATIAMGFFCDFSRVTSRVSQLRTRLLFERVRSCRALTSLNKLPFEGHLQFYGTIALLQCASSDKYENDRYV